MKLTANQEKAMKILFDLGLDEDEAYATFGADIEFECDDTALEIINSYEGDKKVINELMEEIVKGREEFKK